MPDATKKILLFLLTAMLVAGCANRYDITLNNGQRLTGISKPVLHEPTGEYYFTDGSGHKMAVKSMRVRVIEPHRDSEDNTQFKSGPLK